MNSSGIATIPAAGSPDRPPLHAKHREWIEARGISAELAEKFGLHTVNRHGKAWLAVPYVERSRVVNHKYRLISEKRHEMDAGGRLILWNHDCLIEESKTPVVICEGEWDALVATSMGWRAVSVPNGASGGEGELSYLWEARDLLNRVQSFIIATDSDDAGLRLRENLIAHLGADRCSFIETYGADAKDLNDTLRLYGIEAVAETLNNARAVPIRGLYKLSQFPEPAPYQEISLGIPGLSEMLPVVPATLTVLTGWAGQGKTTLLVPVIANLIRNNIAVTLGTFETMPKPVLQRKIRAALIGCPENSIPVTQIEAADAMIERKLSLIAQMVGEDDEMSLEDVLTFASADVRRNGSRVLILDPWNEIEHKRRNGENETEYTNRAIRAVKHFMRTHGVAVWIVAHPKKPDDGNVKHIPGLYSISGSAAWANKADYGVVYSRPDKQSNRAKVHVTKVRMGLPGREGEVELAYDWRISTFSADASLC